MKIRKSKRKKLRTSQGGLVDGPDHKISIAGIAMIRPMRNQETMA
jgi:hypothetical protein